MTPLVNEDPMTWKQADLQWHIDNKVEEHRHLDYKAVEALTGGHGKTPEEAKAEVGKDVAAFANSDGGVLIYGITEDKTTKLPHEVIGVDPAKHGKEWLANVIRSQVDPRIDGLRINSVSLSTGMVAYVVDVPQSTRAPHMAKDYRYYKRYEFASVPMQHYEVEDVRRRESSPRLFLEPHFGRWTPAKTSHGIKTSLMVAVKNDSPTPAMYALIEVLFDMRIEAETPAGWKSDTLFKLEDGLEMFSRTYNWSVTKDLPVWKGEVLTVGHLDITVPKEDREFDFRWRVGSPGMERQEASYKLRVRGSQARLISLDGAEVLDCFDGDNPCFH